MDGTIIGAIITFILCIAQLIWSFIVTERPIKLKETDTLQSIRNKKKNCTILVFILSIPVIISLGYGIANNVPILGFIGALLVVFSFIVMPAILDRIEKKEKLLQENNSFTVAMEKVKNTTLKDSIKIVDEELRKAIISDDIEEIQGFKALFKTGEEYTTEWDTKILFYIMSKSHQDKIIKANIKGVSLEELEGDKVKLIIRTQSGNCFSTTIEKVDLPKWIK